MGITEPKKIPTVGDAMSAFSGFRRSIRPRKGLQNDIATAALRSSNSSGNVSLAKISPQEVEKFKTSRAGETVTVRGKAKDKRKNTGVKVRPATVNRELACLRAMFNHTAKDHPELCNPVSQVKFLAEANQQERVLNFSEQRKYLDAATPTLAAVAGLILETGMRPEEVFTLQTAALRLNDRFLKIERGKTPAARRRVDLTDAAIAILRRRVVVAAKSESPYLFPCDADAKRPLPGIQSAHARALSTSGV